MAQYLQGVSPTQTDTVAQFTLGTECADPRTRDFPNNTLRYIKAGGSIALGDSLIASTADADEPNTLTATSAIQQSIVAIAHVAIASGSFGWVTSHGRVASAKAAASTAANARLGSSASAGTLQTLTQADSNFTSNDYFEALAYAMSPIIALDANDSNGANIEVFIGQG
jgi:hypothetical protein